MVSVRYAGQLALRPLKSLYSSIAVAAMLALPIEARTMPEYADPAAPIEARIDSLIASMTLDEKIQALGTDPSVPRLGLRLSGHIEGLHGVALGGPGEWGRFRRPDGTMAMVGNHPTCNAGWNVCPNPGDGKESVDRKSLDLEQESLIKKVLAANRRTIVVLISSFPNTINWTETHVPAIMLMTHNSQESGNALADVLFGDFNPAGRLVHTWPRSIDQLPPMMDYDIRHGRTYWYFKGTPLYPFGFGLSYTRFHYFRMRTDAAVLPADGSVDVSVDVGNVGNRDGEEVVQLYVQLPQSKISRPERSLKAFQRVALRAGEIRTLHLRLAARDLAYWDVAAHRFVVEAGRVRLLVGASSSDIRLRKVVQMSAALALSPNLQQAYVIN